MDGEFFIGATIATTLTKVALRYSKLCDDNAKKNVSFISLARLIPNIFITSTYGHIKFCFFCK